MNIKNILSEIFTDRNPDFMFREDSIKNARDYIENNNIFESIINSDYREEWKVFFLDFIGLINSDQVNKFLRSKVVLDTMFYEAPSTEFINIARNWNFFKNALINNKVGSPPAYGLYPYTNGNTVHHLYSISQLINNQADLNCYDQIIEFGGGYGNMAWCFKKLGFNGDYFIYDSNVMYVLQKMFLEASNIDGIKFIDKIGEIESINGRLEKKTLIVATWSISEAPLEIRDMLFTNPNNSLIVAFQKYFGDINNLNYFSGIKNRYSNARIYEIRHLLDNYYLIKK